MSKSPESLVEVEGEAPPPYFRSWGRFYAFVVINTLLVYFLLVLFSVYTR